MTTETTEIKLGAYYVSKHFDEDNLDPFRKFVSLHKPLKIKTNENGIRWVQERLYVERNGEIEEIHGEVGLSSMEEKVFVSSYKFYKDSPDSKDFKNNLWEGKDISNLDGIDP